MQRFPTFSGHLLMTFTILAKFGIPPSFIPGWINDLCGFFSHPNRQNDIAFSSNAQNESDKQSNSIKSTKPNRNPNPSSSQLTFPYNIEKLGIKQISHAKEENLQYKHSISDRSHDRKYLINT